MLLRVLIKLVLSALAIVTYTNGNNSLCENRDGNCYDDNFTSYTNTWLSYNPFLVYKINNVRGYLESDKVISYQSLLGLHISYNYLCNYSSIEFDKIGFALQNMKWNSFNIRINSLGCNNDILLGDRLYLHALVEETKSLTNFVNKIEEQLLAFNISVKNPREQSGPKMHVTVATLKADYPTDRLKNLLDIYDGYQFVRMVVCRVTLTNPFILLKAHDCLF